MSDNVVDLNTFKSKKKKKKSKAPTAKKNSSVKSNDDFEKELIEAFLNDNTSHLQREYGLSREEAKSWLSHLQVFADSFTDTILRANEKSHYSIKFAGLLLQTAASILSDELFMMGMCQSITVKEFDSLKASIIEKVSGPVHINSFEEDKDDKDDK